VKTPIVPAPWVSNIPGDSAARTLRLRRRCGPHGYEATREAAMAAFAKSWRRE